MGFQYHVQALSKDLDTNDVVFGAANIGVVYESLEKRKLRGFHDPELERAVAELREYFGGNSARLNAEELELSRRQDLEGELLSEAEGATLERAKKRVVKSARLSKAEARRRVKLIQERTRDWAD